MSGLFLYSCEKCGLELDTPTRLCADCESKQPCPSALDKAVLDAADAWLEHYDTAIAHGCDLFVKSDHILARAVKKRQEARSG